MVFTHITPTPADLFEIPLRTLSGESATLEQFRGQVLLIVNVASLCGFTPQYEGLEKIYREFKERGFAVLGFPCNQFGGQEPGNCEAIQSFCETTYGVTFPLFGKVDVNGDRAHPLFTVLKQRCKGVLGTESIKWNFTKFLIDRSGGVVARFAPTTTPESMRAEIEGLL